jgi:hypothetical protein
VAGINAAEERTRQVLAFNANLAEEINASRVRLRVNLRGKK